MSLAELGISPGKVETIEQVGHYVDDPLAAFAHLCGKKNNALQKLILKTIYKAC